MNLDNVRSLKRELLSEPEALNVVSASALPRAAAMIRISPRATEKVAPIALGVTSKGKQYQLAVRVQRATPGTQSLISYIYERAKGECDVRVVGRVKKQLPWRQQKNRPLRIGGSVGHFQITAGTLGAFVTPRGGGGEEDWILSNNHVLANENRGRRGDPVIQPGKADGGRNPRDVIGELHKFQPLKRRDNVMDAATATLSEGAEYLYDWLDGVGAITGVRCGPLQIGETVFKVGRTTGTTEGRISAIEVDDLVVGFDMGDIVFNGQIEIAPADNKPFSLGGDSGSLIVDSEQRAIGLLFAGNDVDATFANPIAEVLDALDVNLVF